MSETWAPEVAKSLRVLDIAREDPRPRGRAMADAVGVEGVEARFEVATDDLYERGFAIARALRAWAAWSAPPEDTAPDDERWHRPGLPAPTGLEQAVQRIVDLPAKDFDAGYEKGLGEVRGQAAVGRARAIDAVRLLFTALLRQQAGGPINLHIDASKEGAKDRWRLFEPVPTLDF